ncbi:hypothetical protein VOLCADRAFT_82831 [Volvox carteri f. nagariensis]|uniref:Mitochondrial substrate carrier n=1 Tax=Volvox carteri f. nagariensis TaxID=3068 RepID=D8U796_VOLCA|nr:uncharacterized protein VOLCADRAFT_82831 [Volvox carteri f. nagariensis]EFJ44445.1 hypothetical protein VOLCADRAFT_82831 [Volvox carteri f. nagariensis]|eukprot:XP_002954552.1 hypothetical protein VOLCADRAFT_82831 [Volvox carteri f. nagariensis]
MPTQPLKPAALDSDGFRLATVTGLPVSPVLRALSYQNNFLVESGLAHQARHAPAPAQLPIVAASPAESAPSKTKPLSEVLSDAGRKSLGGGIPGMVAMATQVLSLMWMRTTINYQYRYGTDTMTAFRTLYKEGGIPRFYRGLGPALIQGPLSRFGDTAANAGTLALLDSYESSKGLPVGVKTLVASSAAGAFRILLMPVDTCKTIMQAGVSGGSGVSGVSGAGGGGRGVGLVEGKGGGRGGRGIGGIAPAYALYNYLNAALPKSPSDDLLHKLGRSALIGFCSSFVSDCASNSIRVIKTTKQTTKEATTYPQVARMIIEKDGVVGLLGRGLKTKILANGVQGICFTIIWRLGQDWWESHQVQGGVQVGPQKHQTAAAPPAAGSGGGGGGSSDPQVRLAAATPAEEATLAAPPAGAAADTTTISILPK